MRKRANKATLSKRILTIKNELLLGATRSDLLQFTSSWQITDRQLDTYIAQARAEINEINLIAYEDNRSAHIANLYDLLRRSRKDDDKRSEAEALKQLAKVTGVDQPELAPAKDELPHVSEADLDREIERQLGGTYH